MKYSRSYRFSADSAMLPEEVLEEIAAEVMNYHGSGMSVLEMSPDSADARQIMDQAAADLRKLLDIPASHAVRFLRDSGAVSRLPGARDVSADFLSAPMGVEGQELLFADARFNVGPDGVTLAIVPADAAASLPNSAACFPVYCCDKVFCHLLRHGGLESAWERSREKATILYDFLNKSRYFSVVGTERPLLSIAFTAPSAAENEAVLTAARGARLQGLTGGDLLRARLCTALPREGAEALADFLRKYEAAQK